MTRSSSPALHAVLMAGGAGTRFWPASRARRPKHLLPMSSGRSLLRTTIERLRPSIGPERTWIVTSPIQADAVRADVRSIDGFDPEHVVVEPEARDTAPCAALATAVVAAHDPDALVALLPSDHVVADDAAFRALLQRGAELAAGGRSLVTFGIRPTRAATGYGYIERGDAVDDATPTAWVARGFREKPDAATAERYLSSGRHLWNAGIFLWRPSALQAAMASADPALEGALQALVTAARAADADALTAAFTAMPKTSIDYAVMERAPSVVIVEADIGWSDLGSFVTLGTVSPPDGDGNVLALHGGDALLEDSRDCVVWNEGERLVALLGAHDLVVVCVDDAVLVCPKDRAEDIKRLVTRLRERGRDDLL